VNSSTFQLSLTPPIYRFDKSAEATTSLTPGGVYRVQAEGHGCTDINFARTILRASGHEPDWNIAVSNQGLILNRPGQEPQALPYLEEQLPEGRLNLSSEANGQVLIYGSLGSVASTV
jgi:uncharacterized membrane protein